MNMWGPSMREELERVCKLRGTAVEPDLDHLNAVIDAAIGKKNEELEKECGVCYEPMEATIIRLQCGEGCGFTVCGGGCADKVSGCPICHGPITARISSSTGAASTRPRRSEAAELKFGVTLKSTESASALSELDLPGPRGATPLIMLATLGRTAELKCILGTFEYAASHWFSAQFLLEELFAL